MCKHGWSTFTSADVGLFLVVILGRLDPQPGRALKQQPLRVGLTGGVWVFLCHSVIGQTHKQQKKTSQRVSLPNEMLEILCLLHLLRRHANNRCSIPSWESSRDFFLIDFDLIYVSRTECKEYIHRERERGNRKPFLAWRSREVQERFVKEMADLDPELSWWTSCFSYVTH